MVSRTHLSQQAEAAHAAGEDTFTYGLLYQQEDDLARRSREQLDEALKKLDKSVRKARWIGADELACKPDSVPRRRELPRRRGGDHPSGHTVAGCLKRPTRRLGRAALGRLRCRTPMRHSWPCFGWGLPSHPGHPECWCALTAPFHPYHREGGGLFSVALSRESPRIAVSNHPAL